MVRRLAAIPAAGLIARHAMLLTPASAPGDVEGVAFEVEEPAVEAVTLTGIRTGPSGTGAFAAIGVLHGCGRSAFNACPGPRSA